MIEDVHLAQAFHNSLLPQILIKAESPEFRICAANDAFITAGRIGIDQLMDRPFFEAFEDSGEQGKYHNLAELKATFDMVISSKVSSHSAPFRYDLPVAGTGRSEKKYWFAYETPILDSEGQLTHILHMPIDITELISSREVIEENEKLFRFIAEGIPAQVWTIDAHGILEYINPQLSSYSGRSIEEMSGIENWSSYVAPEDTTQYVSHWQKCFSTSSDFQAEVRLKNKQGAYEWYLVKASPVRNGSTISKWIGVNIPIQAEKEKDQLKHDFVSAVSHEIKTPITSVKAFLQVLKMRVPEQDELDHFAARSLELLLKLENLVEELLDVTEIREGKFIYSKTAFDLYQLLKDVSDELSQVTSTNIILTGNLSEPCILFADRKRIGKVISNIVQNGLKFAPAADQLLIRLQTLNNWAIVAVEDFGPGIEVENFDKVFQRFFREGKNERFSGGIGIGLSICSEIVNHHDGYCWIEKKAEKGIVFYVALPLTETVKRHDDEDSAPANTLEINHLIKEDLLIARWQGFHNLASLKEGYLKIVEKAKKYQTKNVMLDHKYLMGSSSQVGAWLKDTFSGLLKDTQAERVAWLPGLACYNFFTLDFISDLGSSERTFRLFEDESQAGLWLYGI